MKEPLRKIPDTGTTRVVADLRFKMELCNNCGREELTDTTAEVGGLYGGYRKLYHKEILEQLEPYFKIPLFHIRVLDNSKMSRKNTHFCPLIHTQILVPSAVVVMELLYTYCTK